MVVPTMGRRVEPRVSTVLCGRVVPGNTGCRIATAIATTIVTIAATATIAATTTSQRTQVELQRRTWCRGKHPGR